MIKLAGALLNKPEVLQGAARASTASPLIKAAARIADKGGSELLRASLPGAAITAGLGTLTTGNPLAGLAIGAADLGAKLWWIPSFSRNTTWDAGQIS